MIDAGQPIPKIFRELQKQISRLQLDSPVAAEVRRPTTPARAREGGAILMEIYLLRHGIAEDARPGQPDAQRALTDEGRDKLRRVLERARRPPMCRPRRFFRSPYSRARGNGGRGGGGPRLQRQDSQDAMPWFRKHRPTMLWEEIRSHRRRNGDPARQPRTVLSSLVAFLLNCPALQVDMKKAALVRIDCDQLGPQPQGVLKWMITPAIAAK